MFPGASSRGAGRIFTGDPICSPAGIGFATSLKRRPNPCREYAEGYNSALHLRSCKANRNLASSFVLAKCNRYGLSRTCRRYAYILQSNRPGKTAQPLERTSDNGLEQLLFLQFASLRRPVFPQPNALLPFVWQNLRAPFRVFVLSQAERLSAASTLRNNIRRLPRPIKRTRRD